MDLDMPSSNKKPVGAIYSDDAGPQLKVSVDASQKNSIIALTENLFINFHKGSTAYIVITFAPAHPAYNIPENYFGKTPIEKNNISAIGIVSYKCDWFPEALLEAYVDIINKISRHYSHIVLYGASMGAYAAIKYSGRLNANTVIALSPFKSIHPEEAPYLGEYHKTFDFAVIENMAIRPADVAGRVYALYDPMHRLDLLCIEDLCRTVDHIKPIKVFFGGHGLPCLVDSSGKLPKLISSALSDDTAGFAAKVSRIRKNSKHDAMAILRHSFRKHPVLSYYAVISMRANRNRNEFLASIHHTNLLIYSLIMRNRPDLARSLLAAHCSYITLGKLSYATPVTASEITPVFTHHGKVLSFNIETKSFGQSATLFGDGANYVVSIEANAGVARACCISAYGRMMIDLPALDIAIELAGNIVSFRKGQYYLRAAPRGDVGFDAVSRGGWEFFCLLPMR